MKKIVLTGGGTAGHVYPALAVAEKLKKHELHYIGGSGMEKDILSTHREILYHEIPTVKLERKLTPKNLLIPFKLHRAIKEAKKTLIEINPDIIFSKGGFVAVPVAIAAKKLHIPLISHESDLSFGLANKIILRFCTKMCTTFAETAKKSSKCVHTGQPIRAKIYDGHDMHLFANNLPTVLVLGGSLGAKFLNEIVYENLDEITKYCNILHICGKKNYQKIVHENYQNFPYAENIEDFYASADIVIARAGSGVINELLALAKPMLLVPLSKKCSRGDQIENAKLFEKLGYARTLMEEDYSKTKLEEEISYLIKNKQKISQKMQKTAKNNATELIANLIESSAKS